MKHVNLLIVIDGFFIGGTETQILATVPDLMRAGVRVVAVGADGPLTQAFQKIGCTIYNMNFPLQESVPIINWGEVEAQLAKIIENEQINIIHAHQIPSARFISHLAKRRKIPMFFTVHGTYYNTSSLKAIVEHKVKIVSVSPPIHDWLMANDIHSKIILNGIQTEQYKPLDKSAIRREFSLSAETPVIVYAGRLAWEKTDICLRTMDACRGVRQEFAPDLRVFIAGGGDGYAAVSKHATLLNADENVEFITCLGEQLEMNRVFSLADCVVGTGRVALEAMACERVVIAAGCRGMVGVVRPDNYDIAIKYHFGDHKAERPVSEAALAVAMTAILASPDSRAKLESEGRHLVESKFNIHDIAAQFVKLYRKTVKR